MTRSPSPKPVEVSFEPLDNQRLARLCGSLDANLRQIESALDVAIARRGAQFTVRGEPAQAARAARALSGRPRGVPSPPSDLGCQPGRTAGPAPAVFNAANEVAVAAFLTGRVTFGGIPALIARTLDAHDPQPADSIARVIEADGWARSHTEEGCG